MISYLSGKLKEKEANAAIIDVGGVGYEATISLTTYYELGEIDSDVSLRIYTYVREDTLQLFGFSTASERALFLKLIMVSGIGPKLAVTMLSGMGAEEIIQAIRTDNLVSLTSIPGIGKKTAERLVIELRDKINEIGTSEVAEAVGTGAKNNGSGSEVYDDTLSALVNLGYQQNAAAKVIKKAMENESDLSVKTLLRRSLQVLSKG